MAQKIAILLVLLTIAGLILDYVVGSIKRKRRAISRDACRNAVVEHDTSSMERNMEEKIEEMETLKNLSGINSGIGLEVRAAMASSPAGSAHRPRLSDSQIVKDIQAKNEEIARMAKARTTG